MSLSSDLLNNSAGESTKADSPCEQKKCECLKLIEFVVDGEATLEEQKHFEQHILDCISCLEQYNLDKTIKESIRNKVAEMEVPSELIESIKLNIHKIL